MRITYLLFFTALCAFGQTEPTIKVVPTPKTIEDFGHQFKGCPENSECDAVMGLQFQRWQDLISKLKDENITSEKKAQFIELFKNKYGIPTEFYTSEKSQQGFKPILFASPCKAHNPKEPALKVLKGTAFLKSLSQDKALIWRDQAQIEISPKDLLIPQPVLVYYEASPTPYSLSLTDQPLFIKNKELYVLKEEDGFFFMLKVSPNGDWKIENVDMANLGKWEDRRENVTCPKDDKKAPKEFGTEFCKSVWDEDQKKTVTVKMFEGCAS